MPVNKSLYPDNWDEIAYNLKESVGWICENCDRICRRGKEPIEDFIGRVTADLPENQAIALSEEIRQKPMRFVLTVAHLNHIPMGVRPENLCCLCSGCHCRYDAKSKAKRRRMKRAKPVS